MERSERMIDALEGIALDESVPWDVRIEAARAVIAAEQQAAFFAESVQAQQAHQAQQAYQAQRAGREE